jgi:hypothetical protein
VASDLAALFLDSDDLQAVEINSIEKVQVKRILIFFIDNYFKIRVWIALFI